MGIGTSIFLIAIGAILKYAINARVAGVEIDTVGVILMIAGVLGLLVSFAWAAMSRRSAPAERTVVRDREIY